MALELLEGVTADTTGDWIVSEGYQGMLRIAGDLGGGTVTIQIKGQDDSALDIQDATQAPINAFAATGAISSLSIPVGVSVRAVLAGATAPSLWVSLD